jgi:hypothetical protein
MNHRHIEKYEWYENDSLIVVYPQSIGLHEWLDLWIFMIKN